MEHRVAWPDQPPEGPFLVGRARERESLREHLAAGIDGQGRLMLIGGAAGIGKTTLVRDLIREARARDMLVLTGHCYDLTNTPPYGPWLDLAAGYRPGTNLPPPPGAFADGRLEGITSQAALFAEVRHFVAALAAVRPVMVVLEDLHWADPASLDLLRHVAGRIEDLPLLLVVTYRVDELTRRHPFYQQLPALIRESQGLRLDLRRLEPDDLRTLVRSRWRLDPADETRLTTYLEQHAEGNPFFATELLRALVEEGVLHTGQNGWILGELDRLIVPPLLRQVIDGRVGRLGEEMRTPLAMAAVIGQEVPLDLWADVGGMREETLLAIVEGAVEQYLLEAEPEGTRVRFVHALTREALYEGVLPPRRRLWHRQTAEVLTARPEADPDAVAYHFQQAGDPRAAEWLIRAGERAQRAYAWLTSGERFTMAADLLAGVPGEERMRARILCRIARVVRFAHPAERLPAVEEAIRLADLVGDAALAAEGLQTRGLLLCYTDDYTLGCDAMEKGTAALEALSAGEDQESSDAEDWLADALPAHALVGESSAYRARAALAVAGMHHRRGILSVCLAYSGRYAEAVAMGERFLAVVGDTAQTDTLVRAACAHTLHGMAVAQAAMGRIAEAGQVFTRACATYNELDHHLGVALTLLNELHTAVLPYRTTDPALRARLATNVEAALLRAGGALPPDVSPRLGRVACLLLDGEWDEVRSILQEGTLPGNSLLRREVTVPQAMIAYHEGQSAVAWSQIRSLLTDGPATPPGRLIFPEALLLLRLAADLALDAGDLRGAREWLEAHDRWVAWGGVRLGCADGLVAWAHYHHAAGDPIRARSCAIDTLTEATNPEQPLVLVAAHQLLGRLAKDAGQWSGAERHVLGALDLAGACAAPFLRAQALVALAELRLAEGRRGDAQPLLAEVTAIATELRADPLRTAAEALASAAVGEREGVVTFPAGLTQREVEVLQLVAQGMTDGAVAARLFISPRTVSQHLRSIYGKLAVSSRAAATRFAVEHHLL
ncbi:MAG: transcriptional regulator, LuxR family [Thermomicrobiales bacterium]|nr:transcriptional regulator, LuxR family [Thermomicrobiales bacterium]